MASEFLSLMYIKITYCWIWNVKPPDIKIWQYLAPDVVRLQVMSSVLIYSINKVYAINFEQVKSNKEIFYFGDK